MLCRCAVTHDGLGLRRLSVTSPRTGNTISVPMHRLPARVFELAEREVARVGRFVQLGMKVGRVDLDLTKDDLDGVLAAAKEAGREEAAEGR